MRKSRASSWNAHQNSRKAAQLMSIEITKNLRFETVRMAPSRSHEATPSEQGDICAMLWQKYLGKKLPARQSMRQSGDTVKRLEVIDIYLDLIQGKSQAEVARRATSASAFGIAALARNIEQRNVLLKPGIDVGDLLLDIHHPDPNAPSPMRSRFWFVEALQANGLIPDHNLDRRAKPSSSTPSVRDVLAIMEEYTGTPSTEICSGNRNKDTVDARFRTIFVMRKVCLLSLTQIGGMIGGRDHTTILNGLNQSRNRMEADVGRRNAMMTICELADTMGVRRHIDFLSMQKRH